MNQITIHTASWLLNPGAKPVAGGGVAIQDGIIIATGSYKELKSVFSASIIDHPGCAIIPGFVNSHTHLELTHFPSWREQNGMGYAPRSFVDWIIQLIKINRGLSPKQLQNSIKEGMLKSLYSGTTTVGDILSRYELLSCYESSPLSERIYFELLGYDPTLFKKRLTDALTLTESISADFACSPALSPHAAYTIAEEHLPLICESAAKRRLPLAIHISESEEETSFMFDTTGRIAGELYPLTGWSEYLMSARRCSATDFFDRNGLLTEKTIAIHCVHLTLADAEKIKERGASICLCPRSNEQLDVGIAPVALFKKLGIPLALGTDSLASNDSLSLWDEMRFALDVFKGVLSPEDLFAMATAGGARGLDLSDSLGSLDVGKRGNFQIIELKQNIKEGSLLESLIENGETGGVYVAGECVVAQ